MEEKKIVKLKDKIIDDPEDVEFVSICLRETGGIRKISEELEKIGELGFKTDAYKILDKAKESNLIDLDSYDSKKLREICKNITDTLIKYKELKILTCLTKEQVNKRLNKIDPYLFIV